MFIEKVKISNIRSIEYFEMVFKNYAGWHVLIGDNGSGKSSIVRAISAALIGNEQIAGILPIWNEWLREGCDNGKIELEILADINFDVAGKGKLTKNTILNIFELKKNKDKYVTLSTNSNNIQRPPTNYNWSNNSGWFSAAYGPFRRFTGGEDKRNKVYNAYPKAGAHLSIFGEEVALTESLDWLKELDRRRLKQQDNNQPNNEAEQLFNKIKKFINKSGVLPHNSQFEGVDIEGDIIFKDGFQNSIKVTQLSDGYRSILSMIFELIKQMIKNYSIEKVFANIDNTEINIPVPGVVIIDEIDTHLHPTWQIKIGHWFTQFFPNIQFIVTTHSPLICRASENSSIWSLTTFPNKIESKEITGIEKEKLIYGNILDAYGTEVFGQSPVRSNKTNEKLSLLGKLNMLAAFGKISEEQEQERLKLQQIFQTDVPII